MSNNNKNITIKFELPQVVNKAIVPLAESVGNTISNLWKGTTIGIETWYNKKKLDQENYLKLYKENIQKELEKIPEDNIQEPTMNILGPALDSSKYYFEKEWYRAMFSKLIAKSCDDRYNNKIHPYFVDAIKQMSPLDAKIMSLFKDHNILPVVNYNYKMHKTTDETPYYNYVPYVFYLDKNYSNPQTNSTAIFNLQRLGLLTIDFNRHILDSRAYTIYNNDPFYIDMKNKIKIKNKSPNKPCEYADLVIQQGIMQITPLGQDFLNICME